MNAYYPSGGYIAVAAGPTVGLGFRQKHRDFLADLPCPDAGAVVAFTVKPARWEDRGTVDHLEAGYRALHHALPGEYPFRFDDTFVVVLANLTEQQAIERSRNIRAALMLAKAQDLVCNSAVGIAMIPGPGCSTLALAEGAQLAADAIHGRGQRIAFWIGRPVLN